jgi:hypothetical protein
MDDRELSDKLIALEATDRNLEQAIIELKGLAEHTDRNTAELVDMFKKAKVIFSFLDFLGRAAAPVAWFIGAFAATVAFFSHAKINFLSLFR